MEKPAKPGIDVADAPKNGEAEVSSPPADVVVVVQVDTVVDGPADDSSSSRRRSSSSSSCFWSPTLWALLTALLVAGAAAVVVLDALDSNPAESGSSLSDTSPDGDERPRLPPNNARFSAVSVSLTRSPAAHAFTLVAGLVGTVEGDVDLGSVGGARLADLVRRGRNEVGEPPCVRVGAETRPSNEAFLENLTNLAAEADQKAAASKVLELLLAKFRC